MPLSSSSVDRRIPEALSTSRGKPAGVSDGNWIQTMPGKGWNTILRLITRWSHSSTGVGALARSSLSTDAEARRQVNPAVLSVNAKDGSSGHVAAMTYRGDRARC
jgi:hypothetical protein